MAKWKRAKSRAEGLWESFSDASLLHRLKLMVSDETVCGRRSVWGCCFFCQHSWKRSVSGQQPRRCITITALIGKLTWSVGDITLGFLVKQHTCHPYLRSKKYSQHEGTTINSEALEVCKTIYISTEKTIKNFPMHQKEICVFFKLDFSTEKKNTATRGNC